MTYEALNTETALGQSVPLSDELDIDDLHDKGIRFVGDMQRLSVNQDDIFVLMFEQRLNLEQRKDIKQYLKEILSGHKVIVLDGNAKIGVIGTDV